MTKRNRLGQRLIVLATATVFLAAFGLQRSFAQTDVTAPTLNDITTLSLSINTVWVMLTGFLVFFMQAGFAMLEAGMIRQTGVVNALMENFVDAGVTALCWWAAGFGIAFGADSSGLFGTTLFAPGMAVMSAPYGAVDTLTYFFFQFAFAATASTIATGGMAERTNFVGDLIYSGVIALIIYPLVAHWVWGGGWLAQLGYHDFAGSTVVHTVGGMVALVGARMLGPRPGRVWGSPPPPHNVALATIGTLILWFGWYGFNPGSTLGAVGQTPLIGLVTLNTTLSASAGLVSAMIFMFLRTGKWNLPLSLNGSLAGLVAITAGCAFVDAWAAVIIGIVAGILVIISADVIEWLHIDDAVGAFPVHGVCGVLGTLAIGFFGSGALTLNGQSGLLLGGGLDLLTSQVIGSAAVVIWVTASAVLMFLALRVFNLLRVHPKADFIGIDAYEHSASAYPDVLPFPLHDDYNDDYGTSYPAGVTGD